MQYYENTENNWQLSLGVIIATMGGAIVYESLGVYTPMMSTFILGIVGWGILLSGIALTIRYVG